MPTFNSDARKRIEERAAKFVGLLNEPNPHIEGEDIERLEARWMKFSTTEDKNTGYLDCGDVPKEVRVTSETGGQKGKKAVEMGRLPSSILDVAAHFSAGADKYPDVAPGVSNWSQGYDWSLSFNAMQRHAFAWFYGEDTDPELGNSHLAAVAFHALVLMDFQSRGAGTDDRAKVT